jgi:hypothetical protein
MITVSRKAFERMTLWPITRQIPSISAWTEKKKRNASIRITENRIRYLGCMSGALPLHQPIHYALMALCLDTGVILPLLFSLRCTYKSTACSTTFISHSRATCRIINRQCIRFLFGIYPSQSRLSYLTGFVVFLSPRASMGTVTTSTSRLISVLRLIRREITCVADLASLT